MGANDTKNGGNRPQIQLSVTLYRRHQSRELVESSLGMFGRPLEPNGEPRSGLASAACG